MPNEVIENGQELAEWNADNQCFTIKLPKKIQREVFKGLDMLTTLLTAPKQDKQPSSIEVIDTENISDDDEDEFDWHFEQTIRTETDDMALLGEKYGFANKYSGVINRLQEEIEIVDIEGADKKPLAVRAQEKLLREENDFDDDHYLADKYEQPEELRDILKFKTVWQTELKPSLDDDDRFKLKNLPRKDHLLSKEEKRSLLLGLIDILFAYAYDMRTTEGDHSVESAWTVCKLSSNLSWFVSYSSLKQTISSSIRRSLIYPLYRNWELSLQVHSDTIDILKQGRVGVLKCLLDIHRLLNESGESRYIINNLYITDYCVWVQKVKEETLDELAKALEEISLSKKDIELDLELLEKAAKITLENQAADMQNVSEQMHTLRVQ